VGPLNPREEQAIRWFVGLSLILGSFVLLGEAVAFGTLQTAPAWAVLLAAVVVIVLAVFTAIEEGGRRSPMGPAAAWIIAVLLAMLWARVDPSGHAFLSGFAAIVAFATGIGILRRQLWAWPVAFASVVGFGPIVLLIAPIPAGVVAAGFLLFIADILGLLVLHRTYFQSR
jgi:hypothetical protein